MSKICFVTGKRVLFGNNVSHSNRKTKRKFFPNLHKLKFWSDHLNKFIKLNVSTKGLRIINKYGVDKVLSKMKKYVKKEK
jgi:large subunit ribosomal protein L28